MPILLFDSIFNLSRQIRMFMNRFFPCLLAFLVASGAARAATGDTLRVQSHTNTVIVTDPSIGNTYYPAWAVFPTTNLPVRKIYAYLTFECRPGFQCGEWDYINRVLIGRKGGVAGDSLMFEIARFITPYGSSWNSSSNWKHGWYLDLTDFSELLRDSVEVIYNHSGYESNTDRGWKINLTFNLIEGSPVRNLLATDTLWNGNFQYGNNADPIENRLLPRSVTLNAQTKAARLCILQTGHGSDTPDGCGEFCAKTLTSKMDNVVIDQRSVWRDNCGWNSLFPQAGTWLFDRANWCPGADVVPYRIDVSGLTGGSTHSFDLDMQSYTATQNFGNYLFFTYLFQYGDPNAQNDATLEAIIAPSTEYQFGRYNPVCGEAIVVIRNNGAQALTALQFNYGIKGGQSVAYNWTGNLPFGQTDTVRIPNTPLWNNTSDQTFAVTLANPNGASDEFPQDNYGESVLKACPVLPRRFVVHLYTNKAATENSYKIREVSSGVVAFQKGNFQPETNYRDTVNLIPNTCYEFEFSDEGAPLPGGLDVNKDGLSFWLWDSYLNNYPQYESILDYKDGTLMFRSALNSFPIKNFTTGQGADFGTKLLYQFRTDTVGLSVTGPATSSKHFVSVFPNPSNGQFTIDYYTGGKAGLFEVTDLAGRTLRRGDLSPQAATLELDLSTLEQGVYILQVRGADWTHNEKLIIRR